MQKIELCENQIAWDEVVLDFQGHPLQMWGWGELKAKHNWRVIRLIVREDDLIIGGAQILVKPLPWQFKNLFYAPRGPVWQEDKASEVLNAVRVYCKNLGGVALTIEPDSETLPEVPGLKHSKNTILIPKTLILDLHRSTDSLLNDMTKKTRQYIRKSSREDLTIRRVTSSDEIAACLDIYRQTAKRAGFALHDDQYYHDVAGCLGETNIIYASFDRDNQPVAFLWMAISECVAFELYGGMNQQGQSMRANYALKWHAINKTKEWGIARYDMNGLLNDGVSNFKRGFAKHENELVGTYDFALSPLYFAWTWLLPRVKNVIRLIKKR